MNNHLSAIVLVIIGLIIIYFRKKIAIYQVDFQNKVFRRHYGEKEIRANEWLFPLLGLIFIGMGILNLLGIF